MPIQNECTIYYDGKTIIITNYNINYKYNHEGMLLRLFMYIPAMQSSQTSSEEEISE